MKKRYKHLISIILMIALCFAELSLTKINVNAAEDTLSMTNVNPLYSDIITEEYIEQQIADDTALSGEGSYGFSVEKADRASSSEMQYCDSVEGAAEQVRIHLKERAELVEVGMKTTTQPSIDMSKEIFDEALKHTGVSTEGDYLKWQYGGWAVRMSWYSSNGTYYITLEYNVVYYTDHEQEQKMDAAVSEVISQLNLAGKSDYEKIAAIYDYICTNTVYDYDNLNDSTYMQKYTAYAALIDKKSVCQGYAVLFYRLALEEGIDARVVTGTGNGGDHAWNIVKIGTRYYNLDATWDAGRSAYSYFLKGTAGFSDHEIGTYSSEIKSNYQISDIDFDPDNVIESPKAVTGLKIGGRASNALRLNWDKNEKASGYIIEQFINKKWTRIARIGSNDVLTFRVENLSPSASYEFRVQSFGFDGSTPLYSEYQYITGKTNPSAVTGLEIGGHASNALRLNWSKNNGASGYIIEQYKNGNWTRIARIADNGTLTYRVEGLQASTVYKFRIKAFDFDGNTALYSNYQTISGTTDSASTVKTQSAVTGLKIGGRATDALRLNWNKNSDASGYIIEQYKNGSWTRIARIGSNSTVTYRVEGLQASTGYKFRVKAFSFDGSIPVYSTDTEISGTTLPTVITGLKIGGTATDALRLNWNKNSKASGYIIEQYKDGTWIRIARIGNNSTVTYRVEGLHSGTSYEFRVRCFGFDGNIPLYSSYRYVSGMTDK